VRQKGYSLLGGQLLALLIDAARGERAVRETLLYSQDPPNIGMRNAMRRVKDWFKWVVVSALPLLLGACAGLPRDASLPVNDPNEDMNRRIMAVNQAFLEPAAELVDAVVPDRVHDRVRDFNSNLKEPRIFVNNVLQGRFEAATRTTGRFVVNSLIGVGGLVDIAGREGLQQQSGDFGQTLFVWGVPAGPYVVRPYAGPSTVRDAVGSVVDMFGDPVGWAIGSRVPLSIATSGLQAVEQLGQLKQAKDASIDFYSFVRSGYYQTRRAQLREAIGLSSVVDSPALDDPEAPKAPADSGANSQSPVAPRR
jgi:phospholipid-binding lipoprotein MlaA